MLIIVERTVENEVLESLSSARVTVDLNELVKQAKEIQAYCTDYNVKEVDSMKYWGHKNTLAFNPDGFNETVNKYLTKYSRGQLCAKLGVPVRYLDKCLDANKLYLATDNINSWLQDYNKPLFIRGYKDKVRGILSDKYSVLDTPDILDVLGETLDTDLYDFRGYYMSPDRLHLRAIQKNRFVNNEDLFAGIQIDSSDVGRSILTVRFIIFKQVCTNGLCLPQNSGILFEQKHIGIHKDDFYKGLVASLSNVPDYTQKAIELVNNTKSVDSIKDMTNDEFVKFIKDSTKMSDEGAKKVIDTLEEHYDYNNWGLINAITEVAQDCTLERRLELERMAGELLLVA